MIYRDVLPKTSARVATCFASGYEAATGKGFVLLEDLTPTGAIFCCAEEPLTPEQAASGLGQLAEVHALFWGDQWLLDPRWRHRGRSLAEPDPLEKPLLEMSRAQ